MIKAAVVGCGRMGAFTSEGVRRWAPECWFPLAHAEAIAAHPGLELAGLCDASADNLARAQAAYGDIPGFGDVQTLAVEVQPALVGIATRTIGRAEIIETLFAAGGTRAFHIEKPLCNSVAELRRLEPTFARDDMFATYGTVRRFFHLTRVARDLVRSGRFGKLVEVRANMGQGALYWVHPHSIDWILFAAEDRKVVEVQARLGEIETGDRATEIVNDPTLLAASIWFEDGVAGHISRGPGLDLVLSCEAGEVIVRSDGRGIDIAESRNGDPYYTREACTDAPSVLGPQGALGPVSELAACLSGDAAAITANAVNKCDIILGQTIAFAFAQSHLQGSRPVKLDEIDETMRILARTGGNYA